MSLPAKHRLRRYQKDRESYDAASAAGNESVGRMTDNMPPSAVRASLRVKRNARDRQLKKLGSDLHEENAFIQRARSSFNRESMYKRGEAKGYARPGDSAHKAALKIKMSRMSGFKRKMFDKAYKDYDPNNQHRRMNPLVKAYTRLHSKDYNTYNQHRTYNG